MMRMLVVAGSLALGVIALWVYLVGGQFVSDFQQSASTVCAERTASPEWRAVPPSGWTCEDSDGSAVAQLGWRPSG